MDELEQILIYDDLTAEREELEVRIAELEAENAEQAKMLKKIGKHNTDLVNENEMLRSALNTVHDTLDDKCTKLWSLIGGEPPIAYQIDYLDMMTINYALAKVLKDD